MKRLTYLITLLSLLLASCTDEDPVNASSAESNKTAFQFSVNMPDFQSVHTRAAIDENAVNDLWLMTFDAQGLFMGRVHASLLTSNNNGTGTFQADIPDNTKIIHLIANYDQWDSFSERAAQQKDEREIIPSLTSSQLVFWGRQTISSPSDTPNVTLYRNLAKATVENTTTNFEVTGYTLCNYTNSGTVAPFNPDASPTPFTLIDGKPTLPRGSKSKTEQSAADCNMEPKYMFENENYSNDQAYIIIKGKLAGKTEELYYKIQLLDTDKKPYPIMRNYHYKVVIKSFSESANGSTTFDDAKTSEPSNNIYAEIFKESPTISDNNNNVLTVSRLHFLFTKEGTLNVSAQYAANGVTDNSTISVSIAEDQGSILHNLKYDGNGNITADVSRIIAGQYEATITVKAGVLSRTITVVSSALYLFDPAAFSPEIYTARDQDVALSFTIPAAIPYYLYPLKCTIITGNLYPVEPNKNLQIEYANGGYQYVYWATSPGTKTLNFRTSLENSDETVLIANEIFQTKSVEVKSRHFTNVSINSNNFVNYGANNTASFMFTIPSYPDYPPTYPLTVFIATENLQTTQSGWTAVTGGYQYTYTSQPSGLQTVMFATKKAISSEKVVISAPGFSPTTLSFENILARSVTVSNTLRIYQNGNLLSASRYTVTSSDTNIVSNFITSRTSDYTMTIYAGARINDVVTLTLRNYSYSGTYTVKELLQSPAIVLQ